MRYAHWMWLACGILVTAGFAACGPDADSPLDAVPEAEALTLEVTDSQASVTDYRAALNGFQAGEESTIPTPGGLSAPSAASAWPAAGVDLAEAAERIAAVNASIRSLFAHIEAVALVGGAPGRGNWYGPVDRCTVDVAVGTACPADAVASFRLWVGEAPGRGGAFALQARPVGSTDAAAFKPIAAGWMRRWGDHTPRRGHGQVWANLDNLAAVAPGSPGRGHLYAGFAARPIAKVETLVLVGFTTGDHEPVTVALRGYKTAAGTRRVRAASVRDYLSGDQGDELGLVHVAYNPSFGGHAYGIVAGGDVGPGTYVLGRACYAAHAPSAPVYREWFACVSGQAPAACILAAGGVGTPADGYAGGWSDCPSTIPSADEFAPPATDESQADPATDPGGLPGEAAADVTAEPAPTSEDDAPVPG